LDSLIIGGDLLLVIKLEDDDDDGGGELLMLGGLRSRDPMKKGSVNSGSSNARDMEEGVGVVVADAVDDLSSCALALLAVKDGKVLSKDASNASMLLVELFLDNRNMGDDGIVLFVVALLTLPDVDACFLEGVVLWSLLV